MTTESIYQTITPIFRDTFDDDYLEVTPELTAKDVPEWDSLNHIRLIVAVEHHFNIRFSTADIQQLNNVSEFVELIAKHIKEVA